jgi:hypothetical protein
MTDLLSTIPPDLSNLINSKQNDHDFVCASYLCTKRLASSIHPAFSTTELFLFKAGAYWSACTGLHESAGVTCGDRTGSAETGNDLSGTTSLLIATYAVLR